jgi:HAAS
MSFAAEMVSRRDVAAYVDEVRACLADLAPEDRDELVDGLEADLTERLAESAGDDAPTVAFGPPGSYADELRTAAGYAPSSQASENRLARLSTRATRLGDRLRETRATSAGQAVESFLAAIVPVWWFVRAWVALQFADLVFGSWPHSWMVSVGSDFLDLALLAAATVVSVQIGRGQWWPGTVASGSLRLLVPALNVFAAVMVPVVAANISSPQKIASSVSAAYYGGRPHATGGLRLDGTKVDNIYAYDSSGKPLVGVQLYDGDGNPIAIGPSAERLGRADFALTYAWPRRTGDSLGNVFPLPISDQPDRGRVDNPFSGDSTPQIKSPFATVPALPGETLAAIRAATAGADAAARQPGKAPGAGAVRGGPGTGDGYRGAASRGGDHAPADGGHGRSAR